MGKRSSVYLTDADLAACAGLGLPLDRLPLAELVREGIAARERARRADGLGVGERSPRPAAFAAGPSGTEVRSYSKEDQLGRNRRRRG